MGTGGLLADLEWPWLGHWGDLALLHMTLILCSHVQERSLGHGGGARERTAPCKVGRDLGLE